MAPGKTDTREAEGLRSGSAESTAELVSRAQCGDRAAVDRLFTRHLAPLRRFVRGRLPAWARTSADTDDLVQDALLKTFNNLKGFEPRHPGALQAYLRLAVMNRLRDEVRSAARRPPQVNVDDVDVPDGSARLVQAVGFETMTAYKDALGRLRPEEQEAVIGRIEMGYSYEELAMALDKPTPDAARKAAQRALLRLAQEMRREPGV